MASVSGTSSSSYTSSLYNSANIISGLASGMDTEGMIESLVQSYQTKIQNLSDKVTTLGWKQDAYRSIISKMVGFSNKYTSYTSSTNLMSSSFFTNAINVKATGSENSKYVTASGRTDSDVRLNSVSQLATSARYVTSSNLAGRGTDFSIEASSATPLDGPVTLSTLTGSLGITYGSKTVSINFNEATDILETNYDNPSKAEALASMIRQKLGDQQITLSNGDVVSAADRIAVNVDKTTGEISFSDKSGAGNSVYISSASDSAKSLLGGLSNLDDKPSSFTVSEGTSFTKTMNTAEYISGKSMNISLDGTTKSITMPEIVKKDDGSYKIKTTDADGKDVELDLNAQNYTDTLNASLKKAFGNKVSVENLAADPSKPDSNQLQLKFNAPDNSNLIINTSVGDKLGIGSVSTNYLNTSKTLGDLLEGHTWETMRDDDGNLVNKPEDFYINGVKIGSYTKDTKLSDIMADINANSEAGVKVSYSKTTREFVFTTKETGSQSEIKLGDGLAKDIFGVKPQDTSKTVGDIMGQDYKGSGSFELKFDDENSVSVTVTNKTSIQTITDRLNRELKDKGMTAEFSADTNSFVIKDKDGNQVDYTYGEGVAKDLSKNIDSVSYTAGTDAKFSVTVNGTTMDMVRSSNDVDIDGMTINFKNTFEDDGQGVTFERSVDSDKIVDTIRSMIDDYNELMTELRNQYATLPYQNSSGAFQSYGPLTEEEKATMSESAINSYEEKAKQGLLFGDRNLSNLYEQLRQVFSPSGADGALLSKIGISVGFDTSTGASTITLDESKLRTALDNDPDEVAELFTKSKENGAATNGLMQGMKTQLDRYAGLTGATKGILVQQAGTPLNSLSLLSNEWQSQIDDYYTQIESWQDKLESQVDRYTSMFSKLEVLINQMNSQSSTLAGMMGG